MNAQPLIDSARLKFSGISSEDFEDIPDIGETRTFTITAQCTKHIEEQMANEGTRKIANMKIEKILTGVDNRINDTPPAEPSLFDSTPETETKTDDKTPSNVVGIGQGPQFSAGD
ncbi:hypothetical protein D4768_09835 [Rhodococcus erythropolis]|uniref:DUF7171 family protein n=1 Tax=Rhodococcus erythropolis TaxID=1833 RepID=UPI001F2E35A4|nr:hypothetical protein [Rhodococcus erythropolis]UJC77968.1 hypothetical protein D4768_09835 [Rhodococcus erythropolis]